MSTFAFLFSEMVQYNHGRVTALTQLHEKYAHNINDKKAPFITPPLLNKQLCPCDFPQPFQYSTISECNIESLEKGLTI